MSLDQVVPFLFANALSCHFGNTDTCSDISWYHRTTGIVWVSSLPGKAGNAIEDYTTDDTVHTDVDDKAQHL